LTIWKTWNLFCPIINRVNILKFSSLSSSPPYKNPSLGPNQKCFNQVFMCGAALISILQRKPVDTYTQVSVCHYSLMDICIEWGLTNCFLLKLEIGLPTNKWEYFLCIQNWTWCGKAAIFNASQVSEPLTNINHWATGIRWNPAMCHVGSIAEKDDHLRTLSRRSRWLWSLHLFIVIP
jgi:hypothetical protein